MKNSFTSIFVVLLLVGILVALTTSSFAKDKFPENLTATAVLDNYVEIISLGNVENLQNLFSNDFKQTMSSNAKALTYARTDIIKFLKANKGQKQNCKISYTVVEENTNCFIAKVLMKYENFTRVEYVTICNENKEWKINQIIVSYN
ncbi:nuclear transport factor 2 family protein [Sphingobacterium sp. SRCM116780]|uniref:nuclear transport factor 2 family protein n=1 Tax=Sphingobacterium sp. SRCM116780 TaxID=2907623 RepID=UPI001F37D863|nr:nuclear transport factor 2 family protein [Sphingobacterium sp. SRCM116780]UIR57788.1 nuclear transport factor 2 family protein [Sphingobacterium sp. SRCM116780]